MGQRYNEVKIGELENRVIFFDANILIYLFWTSGGKKQKEFEDKYATIFLKLLNQKNKLVVDFMIISEMVNRTIKMEYEKYLENRKLTKKECSYKRYRNSLDGKNILADIYQIVGAKIIRNFEFIGKAFTRIDVQNFLAVDQLDFNDKGIVQICQEFNCVLLTNDGDFAAANIDILTANNKLYTS
ncbi:MAG: type II toxin-antitoxin system VapC family toxin [Burkholderiales bacterium]|nr:type II toxin-antitoxin system VapC family toxin [Burkholderiales bacterium]